MLCCAVLCRTKGLNTEEQLVYQEIRAAGNRGESAHVLRAAGSVAVVQATTIRLGTGWSGAAICRRSGQHGIEVGQHMC